VYYHSIGKQILSLSKIIQMKKDNPLSPGMTISKGFFLPFEPGERTGGMGIMRTSGWHGQSPKGLPVG